MAKRFIDTGLFDDEWFSELSVDSKLFWVYYLTKCDHAGLLKYNKKLIEFQTGIKSIEKAIEHIGDRLIRVSEVLLFCPKFIQFQYPDFPKSKVLQQEGAVKLLQAAGLWDSETNYFKSSIRVDQVLTKTIVNGSVNGSVNVNGNKEAEILNFVHKSEAFRMAWEQWVEYRKQIKKAYKSQLAKQAALDKLGKCSELDAIAMMNNSMAGQWQGLFEIDGKSRKKGELVQ